MTPGKGQPLAFAAQIVPAALGNGTRHLAERISRLIEAPNVRETAIFPRDINRIQP